MSRTTYKTGPWSKEEDAQVRSFYATHSSLQMVAILGRSESAIRNRCWTLRLGGKSPPWTQEEVSLLKRAYSIGRSVDLDALAGVLGRHKTNICRKARGLGLTDQNRPKAETCTQATPPVFLFDEERRAEASRRAKLRIATKGHPRGALGMKHTEENKKRQSEIARAMWRDPDSKINSPEAKKRRSDLMYQRIREGKMPMGEEAYSRAKKGYRPDIPGYVFRSRWEANYARYLNFLVKNGEVFGWSYESQVFEFHGVPTGVRSYMADFEVILPDGQVELHEVKGWLDENSKTRLGFMQKFYPSQKLVLIDKHWFKRAKVEGLHLQIPGWESEKD